MGCRIEVNRPRLSAIGFSLFRLLLLHSVQKIGNLWFTVKFNDPGLLRQRSVRTKALDNGKEVQAVLCSESCLNDLIGKDCIMTRYRIRKWSNARLSIVLCGRYGNT